MLCPLLYSPSSSLLSFSLILHFDIFLLKKKQPKFYSNPLSLRSLFSPVFARLLFPPRSFSILFIISPHFIHFSFSSLTPSSCLTHNHSRLISITQHLSLLPFFPAWAASLVLLPNGCRLQPRPFFPLLDIFRTLLVKLSTLSFLFF